MIKENFYTGQPVEEPLNLVDTKELDKKNMMMQFSNDPNQRMNQMNLQQSQQPYNPFMPAYNPPIQQPQYGGYIGNPAFQTGYGFGGYAPNPVFGGGYGYSPGGFNNYYGNRWMQQPSMPKDQVVHVPGFNFSNSGLMLSADAEEICDQLQLDMMMEQEEAAVKRNQRFQGYFNNNGYNYYGMPYYNSYQDMSITRKYIDKINEIKKEATKRRNDFNKNLLKMAYHYQGAEIDEETLNSICDGYDYVIPANTIQMQAECSRFKNMVPISNQQVYAQQYQDDVNFHNYLNGDKSMNGFFGSLGVMQVCDELAAEQHRRRDGSQLYSSDSYRRYLRKHIAERDGLNQSNGNGMNAAQVIDASIYPTLGNAGKLLDDGTISITTPSWIGGGADSFRRITLNNEMEKHFEENRQAFLQSIYSQEGINNGVIKTGTN